jgi:hypothetical protein
MAADEGIAARCTMSNFIPEPIEKLSSPVCLEEAAKVPKVLAQLLLQAGELIARTKELNADLERRKQETEQRSNRSRICAPMEKSRRRRLRIRDRCNLRRPGGSFA